MTGMFALVFTLLAPTASTESPAATVRGNVVAFNEAYAANDLDAYFSYYAPEATFWFDTGRVTLEEYEKSWRGLVAGGGGVEKNELSDVRIRMSPRGDVAVATYLVDVVTRHPDGRRTRDRSAETDVWFLENGSWKIVHIHYDAEPVE